MIFFRLGTDAARNGNPNDGMKGRLGIDLFQVNSRRAGASQLPQLMLKKSVSVGPIHDIKTLRQMLQEEIGPRMD
ncbi:MAG: hypothetical protein Q7S40_05865 [Opitutaceae bacterium]|nr:hypothetical protein [Opitutaceae bacterium]